MANDIKDVKISDLIKSFPVKALAWGALPIALACYVTGDATKTDLLKNPAFIGGAIAVTTGVASGAYYSSRKDEQPVVVEQSTPSTTIKALPPATSPIAPQPLPQPVQEIESPAPVRSDEFLPNNLSEILRQGGNVTPITKAARVQPPKTIRPVEECQRAVVREAQEQSDPWESTTTNGVM